MAPTNTPKRSIQCRCTCAPSAKSFRTRDEKSNALRINLSHFRTAQRKKEASVRNDSSSGSDTTTNKPSSSRSQGLSPSVASFKQEVTAALMNRQKDPLDKEDASIIAYFNDVVDTDTQDQPDEVVVPGTQYNVPETQGYLDKEEQNDSDLEEDEVQVIQPREDEVQVSQPHV